MKLVLTLLVRDEEDIIHENILFHLNQGVDHIIITDNNSVDSTRDIISEFEKKGLVDLILEPEDNYSQWKWVTRMARLAIEKHKADWTIHSDADEFWWPSSGNLKDLLGAVPGNFDVVIASRFDFIPRPEEEGPLFDRMVIKNMNSVNHIGKPLPPKICHRPLPDIVVGQGNHKLLQPQGVEHLSTTHIEILHFPMRSYKQFENKIALGGAAYERNTELSKNMAKGWRHLYEEYKNGRLKDYYNDKILKDEDLAEHIRNGTFVMDTRLRDYLKASEIIKG